VQHQTVSYQHGAGVMNVKRPFIADNVEKKHTGQENRVHGLLDFLARPVSFYQVPMTVGDARSIALAQIDLPTDIWSVPVWADKLKNFRFFRCTVNFVFLVNASPFDTGRLYALWSPFNAYAGVRRPAATRTNVTGYTGVEIDLGNQETVEFKIPFVSWLSHMDQTTANNIFGSMILTVLTPFQSTNAGSSASIDIQMYLTDVDLTIPTPVPTLPMLAQMNGEENEGLSKVVVGTAAKVVKEASNLVNKPVKTPAPVPGWVENLAAPLLSNIGFSKPVNYSNVSPFENIPGKGYTHVEDVFNGVTVGAMPNNQLEDDMSTFGTTVDEMNFAHVCARSVWYQSFSWALSAQARDLLYLIDVSPGVCGSDTWPSGSSYDVNLNPTPMAWVAGFHQFWRGSLIYRFSAVKNAFYSGRLRFVFFPGYRSFDVGDYNSLNVHAAYSWIWDLKLDSDLEITIPYQNNAQWSDVRLFRPVRPNTNYPTLDSITGVLAVFVDNPLRAPSTCPSTVNINCYIRGGHDLEFAIPTNPRYVPFDWDATDIYPSTGALPMVAQMMTMDDPLGDDQEKTGDDKEEGQSLLEVTPGINTYPVRATIGEKIDSIGKLIKRFTLVFGNFTPTVGAGYMLDPKNFFNWNTGSSGKLNPLAYFSWLYRFYRGSIRYMFFVRDFGGQPTGTATLDNLIAALNYNPRFVVATNGLISGPPLPYSAPTVTFLADQFEHSQFLKLNPVVQVTLPFYSNVPQQLISVANDDTRVKRMSYIFFIYTLPTGYLPPKFDIYQAAGDDWRFGTMVAPPILFDRLG
jgi:hypothetical protein